MGCSKHPHSWKQCTTRHVYAGKTYAAHGAFCGKCHSRCPRCFPPERPKPPPSRTADRGVYRKETGRLLSHAEVQYKEQLQEEHARLQRIANKAPFLTAEDIVFAVFECRTFNEFRRHVSIAVDFSPLEHFVGLPRTPQNEAAVRTVVQTIGERVRS